MPQGFSRHRHEGILGLLVPRAIIRGFYRCGSDLSKERRPVRDAEALRGRIDAIVIGASAGGVEALSVLLPGLPSALKPPVIIVLHLPRERPSLLTEIFARKCALQVKEAEDKMRVEPGTVYFAPPDYHLLLDEGPQFAL